MSFEINDGKEHLPDEEDVYGVNDIEERERFDALFGGQTQEERLRRRRRIVRGVSLFLAVLFLGGLVYSVLRSVLGR